MKILLTLITLFAITALNAQTANYWIKKNDWPALKRERAVAFTIGNYAYVGLGVDTAEIVHSDFWKYDPGSDTWSQIPDMPGDARRNASCFSIGDNGYVGGGMNHPDAPLGMELNDFYKYNATSNSWSSIATFPAQARYFATGFAVNGKGYICCGKKGPNFYDSGLFEYNPSTDSWAQKAAFPGGVRYQLCSFVIENTAYVGLGTDQDMFRKDFYAYNSTTDSWTQIADLPASQRASTHTFTLGQRGFVCMGNNGSLLDDLWEYNPFTDAWSVRATYGGSSRKNGVGFALNNRGYVGIGGGYSGKKQSYHQYVPAEVIGIGELEHEFLTIYPNPAADYINIKKDNFEINQLEIYSLDGKRLLKEPFSPQLDISYLKTGTYVIMAKDKKGLIVANNKIQKL